MTLSTLQTKLTDLGFDCVISDKTLEAAKEVGEMAFEITANSGGEVLVVKKTRKPVKNKEINIKGKAVPIVCEFLEFQTFRTKLTTLADFDVIEKNFLER